MLENIASDLLLDPITRALRGESRCSDLYTLLIVGCVVLLVVATRMRHRREAWLAEAETCRYLDCGNRFPRREMKRVQAYPDRDPVWMCPRCFGVFGNQYPSRAP